jgi:hypothetical protein
VEPCLRSLTAAAAENGHAEVIIVDHGSTDGSGDGIRARFPSVRVVPIGPSGTAARARNAGAARARGDVLCFVDADCVVPSDYLSRVGRTLESTGAGAVGGRAVPPAGSPPLVAEWAAMRNPVVDGPCGDLNGSALSVCREAFAAVGGFDETLPAGEDSELCLRLAARGVPIVQSRSLSVTHLDNPTSLREFFAREAWHGLGMLVPPLWPARDLATAGTLVHGLFFALAAAGAALPVSAAARAALAAALLAAVPAAAVLRRALATRRVPRILIAFALYESFFTARLVSLAVLAWRAATRRGRVGADSGAAT